MEIRTDPIVCEVAGAAVWLRLNRPEVLNALGPESVAGLHAGLEAAAFNPEVRSVVITGTGRAFCAGADLNVGSGDDGHAEVTQFVESVSALLRRIETYPKPVIAAVNGIALGGGFELVLACDIVVAAAGARLGDGHAVYGFVPAGGATVRLPRRVGLNHAKYLMFTGELLPASDPRLAGLVCDVADDGELEERVAEICDTIAARSPLGVQRMKALVNDAYDRPVDIGLREELLMSDVHRRSADQAEGLAAFGDSRKPHFTGT
jgi:enoyl-CoA hydratase/carnithine racemase